MLCLYINIETEFSGIPVRRNVKTYLINKHPIESFEYILKYFETLYSKRMKLE